MKPKKKTIIGNDERRKCRRKAADTNIFRMEMSDPKLQLGQYCDIISNTTVNYDKPFHWMLEKMVKIIEMQKKNVFYPIFLTKNMSFQTKTELQKLGKLVFWKFILLHSSNWRRNYWWRTIKNNCYYHEELQTKLSFLWQRLIPFCRIFRD